MFPPGVGFGRAVPRVSEGDQGVYSPHAVIAQPSFDPDPNFFHGPPNEAVSVRERLAQGKTAYPIEEGEALFALDESKEPDMDELRKIALGELDPTGYKRPPMREPPVGMCEYRELDPESNEWVYCSLPVHDPKKQRHVPGRRESA
jgi:hypothetical protein